MDWPESQPQKPLLMHPVARCLFACLLASFSLPALAEELPPLSHMITGGDSEYTVKPGDFLIAIGARLGIAPKLLAQQNAIPYEAIIHPGQKFRVHNPHIVPATLDDGILINIPQRMLFYFNQGRLVSAYPVGLGKPSWPTPQAEFRIADREVNKPWKVPKSIQEEMRREGKVVQEEVPPGPDNPLGTHWLGLTLWSCGIHGTIAPSSVYHFQSHGCIRLHPDDVAELYDRVKVGTPGRIIYQPVLLAVIDGGRILLEVNRDIYDKGIDPAQTVRDLAEANGLSHDINWPVVNAVIAAQDGIARDVGPGAHEESRETP
ncbi:MAG: L,D-transpeptidase family protein [Thiobacillaceae bacterium]